MVHLVWIASWHMRFACTRGRRDKRKGEKIGGRLDPTPFVSVHVDADDELNS